MGTAGGSLQRRLGGGGLPTKAARRGLGAEGGARTRVGEKGEIFFGTGAFPVFIREPLPVTRCPLTRIDGV